MLPTLALFSVLTALTATVSAVPCVQFDSSWNLYAFGGSEDVKLGANTTWAQPQVSPLSTSGRPPWTGTNSQCILSQTNNALYVVGGDSSDLSKIYVYNFASDSWSTQTTSGAPSDLGNSRSSSVLDHDTNVIYTLTTSSGLYQLDMSSVTNSAQSSALAWEAVENSSFSVDGYSVTATQAANHIFYFGVPNTAAGSANVFVVHYAYFQPDAQAFSGSSQFPDTAGQAISIPTSSDSVPYSMVFVPNDFSNTYIATHWTDLGDYSKTDDAPFATNLINSTQTLAAPTSQDKTASYAASPYDLVQIDSTGAIYYYANPVNGDYTVSSGGSWQKLSYAVTGGSTGSSNSTTSAAPSGSASASGSAASGSAGASRTASGSTSASASGSAASASGSSSPSSGAPRGAARGDLLGLAIGVVALGASMLL
ncbi:uncharacterized protein I303_102643 [Kwoniella dejecticola CBS 10117]|uniref:Kelch repeat-containing protein n=1 Tax=Kwoniella dejecticola CBS 10117 TaxID=1296121 RepID=A0A1A6A9B4_9TREE|nr:uncharacterized protein I303_02657 [Kwoniella dejecticola CBS 10117]OBR86648.1 hypothetical protein I303_02657 [Kwoniella dejecticola CBS 10117]